MKTLLISKHTTKKVWRKIWTLLCIVSVCSQDLYMGKYKVQQLCLGIKHKHTFNSYEIYNFMIVKVSFTDISKSLKNMLNITMPLEDLKTFGSNIFHCNFNFISCVWYINDGTTTTTIFFYFHLTTKKCLLACIFSPQSYSLKHHPMSCKTSYT